MKKTLSITLTFVLMLLVVYINPINANAYVPSDISGEWVLYKAAQNGFINEGETYTCPICQHEHTVSPDLFHISVSGNTLVLTTTSECALHGTYTLETVIGGEDDGECKLSEWPYVGPSGKHQGIMALYEPGILNSDSPLLNLYVTWSSYYLYFARPKAPSSGDSYLSPLEEELDRLLTSLPGSGDGERGSEEVTVEWNIGDSLPIGIMKRLQKVNNVSLLFSFTYEGVDHKVMIPAGEAFADEGITWYGPLWLLEKYGEYDPGKKEYTIESGDTLKKLAKKFGISLEELIKKNPQIKDPSKIYTGQFINY